MVGQFIDTFWRKSFIGDLQRAKKVSEDDNQWSLSYDGKLHLFQFVWIQGICVKIDKNADLIIIEDSTGQAQVYNHSRIPEVSSINEGDYIMVGGKLISSSSSDQINIHLYKIQCLKSSIKHELNWPFEVVDISQRIYYKI